MNEPECIKFDNDAIYMNLHTVVFPDNKFSKEIIESSIASSNVLTHYVLHALFNAVFATKNDAISFYEKCSGKTMSV